MQSMDFSANKKIEDSELKKTYQDIGNVFAVISRGYSVNSVQYHLTQKRGMFCTLLNEVQRVLDNQATVEQVANDIYNDALSEGIL